jgi:hypothetical protein
VLPSTAATASAATSSRSGEPPLQPPYAHPRRGGSPRAQLAHCPGHASCQANNRRRRRHRACLCSATRSHALGPVEARVLIYLCTPQVKTLPPYPDTEVHVPEGHIWIEGALVAQLREMPKVPPELCVLPQATNVSTRTIQIVLGPFVPAPLLHVQLILICIFAQVPCGLLDAKLAYIVWPPNRTGPLKTPPTPDARAPRDAAWRRDMAALERDAWRRQRVTHGSSSEVFSASS